jgi:pimeloyl-ACP methyl ester carboxylesterase
MPASFVAVEGSLRVAYDDIAASSQSEGTTSLTLVLLPSLGDIRQEYRRLIPLLAQYRLIVLDLRGMGESDVGFSSYTPLDTGKDIVCVLDALNLSNALLVGSSMCAASVTFAAAERPDRVRGLVFLSPFAWDHTMPFGVHTLLNVFLNSVTGASFWTSYYESLYTLKPSTVSDLKAHISMLKTNLNQHGRMAALRGHIFGSKAPCAARAPELNSKPLLVVYGSKDPDFPGDDGVSKEIVEMKKTFPHIQDSNVLVLQGPGHYPQTEMPDKVAEAIMKFILSL